MADFDADGDKDLITGCFEGGSYLLPGRKGGGFGEPRPVLDKKGNPLRVGRYWDREAKKWSEVSTSKFKESLGIAACPVDWDADGDLDLLLGTHDGRLFLRLNEGSQQKPAFATENIAVKAGGKDLEVPGTSRCPARSPGRHAMPVAADWDGDGLWDLVTGSATGAVYWYRNTGQKGAPVFAAAQTLVGAGSGGEPGLGQRTQVAVADFDADGRVDLLVGDYRSAGKTGEGRPEYHGWVWLLRRKPVPHHASDDETPDPRK
ncbi:MAG: FG-GAP repeat domain-containing protein [Planctomycetota bacterium]